MIELLFEGVATFLFEALAELLGEGVGRLLRTRVGRLLFSAAVGLGGGFVWGVVLADRGQTATPRTLWVSATFALAGVVASFVLRANGVEPESGEIRLLPWRWTPHQWEAFALLNVFVALGVFLGFDGGAT